MSEERQLINNAGIDAPESCGICGDTGLVDHDDGDAYGCAYCSVGSRKITNLFLRASYAVNDINPAVRKPTLRLGLPEYAKTPAGQRDPHLDAARASVMAARRAERAKKEVATVDRPTDTRIPTPRAVLALPGRSQNAQRGLRDGEVGAGPGVPVDGPRPQDDHREDGGAGQEGAVAGDS